MGFVILPGCPACAQVIAWFGQEEAAFSQINFLLVAPATTPELVSFVQEYAAKMQVLLDQDGILGSMFGVTRAPTVFLSVDGMHINRLDWPFPQQELLLALEDSLRTAFEIPDPTKLLGQAASEFTAIDLVGREIALADLPRPLLLSFFNPFCPPCGACRRWLRSQERQQWRWSLSYQNHPFLQLIGNG